MRATSRDIYVANVSIASASMFDPTSERIQHAAGLPLRQRNKRRPHAGRFPSNTCIHGTTYSREEVLYDMRAWHPAAASTCADALAWHLPAAFAEGRALYTYTLQAAQEMACDAGREESRAPIVDGYTSAGFAYHPTVRRWAEETAAAGYDPAHMLAEWEVFWRRKGL